MPEDFVPSTQEGEYLIGFDTQSNPGKIGAIRVRIDFVEVQPHQMHQPFRIDLAAHPLYEYLKGYVKSNA